MLERHAEVDVHYLGGALVDEDIAQVSVPEAQNVARDGRRGDAACVGQSPLDPGLRRAIFLLEEVMEGWSHLFAALEEGIQHHLDESFKK